MAVKVKQSENYKELVDAVSREVILGKDGGFLSREKFFLLSDGMSDAELEKARVEVLGRVEKAQQRRSMDEFAESGQYRPGELERDRVQAANLVSHWFRRWTRLAGHIDHVLTKQTEDGTTIDENTLSRVCEGFIDSIRFSRPEYMKFRDNELMGYVYNQCIERMLDYTKLSPAVKTLSLERKFMEDFPFYIDDKQGKLLTLASKMGKGPIVLSLVNGEELGTDSFKMTSIDKFFPVFYGPKTSDGKRVGGIAFKGTNCYAIVSEGMFQAKAVPWEKLERPVKCCVLERVYDKWRYGLGEGNNPPPPGGGSVTVKAKEEAAKRDTLPGGTEIIVTVPKRDPEKKKDAERKRKPGIKM